MTLINRRTSAFKSRGVTLIEMMVGLVIIAIGMTVAVPSFNGMIARNKVATDVNEMLLAVNLARSEASRTGAGVSVQASNPTSANEFGAGWCVVPSTQTDCAANVIRAFPGVDSNATLDFVDADGATAIVFSPRGGLVGSNSINIDYCYEGQQGRRIAISFIGRSKSHKPDDPDVNKRPDC